MRVTNNGSKFAQFAMSAATAGRIALEEIGGTEPYKGTGPSLARLFIDSVDAGSQILGQSKVKLSEVATFGSWCYSQAAILGMIVSNEPDQFIRIIWDPERIDRYWEFVEKERDEIDNATADVTGGLGYNRMITGYSELYGPATMAGAVASNSLKKLERLADAGMPISDAGARWSVDTAMGLGVGIRRPDFVQGCLESEANPDRESWARAHEAGLDIPAEPDPMLVGERVDGALALCPAFFNEFYPEAGAKLDELIPPKPLGRSSSTSGGAD